MPRHEHQEPPATAERGSVSSEAAGVRRPMVVGLLLLAILIPFAVTAVGMWTSTGKTLHSTQKERAGVAYLVPLVKLLSATVDAETTAVGGHKPNAAAVQAAIRDVDAVNTGAGSSLDLDGRWTRARERLDALLKASPTGSKALDAYAQQTDLLLTLVKAVADSSTLILDPQLDSYYLMNATALRVPHLLVNAGRMSDAVAVLRTQASGSPQVAVVADRVRTDSEEIVSALQTAFGATTRPTLAKGLIPVLDKFADSTAILVPPTADYAVTVPSVASLETSRQWVRDSALMLESAALTELDALLANRADGITSQRRLALVAAAAGALLALGVLWFGFPQYRSAWWRSRRRRSRADGPRDVVGWSDADAGGPVREPQSGLPGAGEPARVGAAIRARGAQ